MSYTDGLVVYESADTALNASPAAINRIEAAVAPVCLPCGGTIVDWCVVLTGGDGGTNATRPIFEVRTAPKINGTYTKASGVTIGRTAAGAALAQGSRHRSLDFVKPINIPPGGAFEAYISQAEGASTNTARVYVVVRLNGAVSAGNTTNSPVYTS